ncbi:MAG: hypothetical protein DMG80_06980, partial [Acidobacteria bacterium]
MLKVLEMHRAGQGSEVVMVFLTILLVLARTQAFAADSSAAVELRIIVVSSQTEAEQILHRLQEGGDFVALAR